MNDTDIWILLAVLVVLLSLCLHLGARWLEARLATLRRRKQARRAGQGEQRAARLLERFGYHIECWQPVEPWPVLVAGERLTILLRADFLVRHGGELFVAEVKTGDLVASVRHGPTRRQLLEYQLAYAAAGVVLVDVLGAAVLSVRFPALEG